MGTTFFGLKQKLSRDGYLKILCVGNDVIQRQTMINTTTNTFGDAYVGIHTTASLESFQDVIIRGNLGMPATDTVSVAVEREYSGEREDVDRIYMAERHPVMIILDTTTLTASATGSSRLLEFLNQLFISQSLQIPSPTFSLMLVIDTLSNIPIPIRDWFDIYMAYSPENVLQIYDLSPR